MPVGNGERGDDFDYSCLFFSSVLSWGATTFHLILVIFGDMSIFQRMIIHTRKTVRLPISQPWFHVVYAQTINPADIDVKSVRPPIKTVPIISLHNRNIVFTMISITYMGSEFSQFALMSPLLSYCWFVSDCNVL